MAILSSTGRFHLVMYDVDAAFSMTDMFTEQEKNVEDGHYSGGRNYLIQALLNLFKNKTFQKKFITTYCIVAGSIFEQTRSEEITRELLEQIRPALALEGFTPDSSGESIINHVKNAKERTVRMTSLSNYFDLGSAKEINFYSELPEARFLLTTTSFLRVNSTAISMEASL